MVNDAVNASSGAIQVDSGEILQVANGPATLTGTGVLRGSGQLSGDVVNTSGTVRPGSSPGTLTITGDYTQGAGGPWRSRWRARPRAPASTS